jgi:lipopolysaccharide export system protein LptA
MLRLVNKFLLLLLILSPTYVWALDSDKEQPIEVEADHAQIDELKGMTQYKGNAIVTQGTLRLEGDIITFYLDKDKQIKKVIAQGKRAKYQQVQTPGEAPVKARALTMEYHAKSQMVYLIGQGYIWKNGDEFSGPRIEYDIDKNSVNASSQSTNNGEQPKKNGRIHMIIQPASSKKKAAPVKTKETFIDPTITEGYPSATVTTTLNARTGPGTQYSKVGVFANGSVVYILTQQNDWVQVRGMINNEAAIGWVAKRYIQKAD